MAESPRLASAVAIVTGASSGIGEATALALAREGATVALVARRAERLEELAELIATEGPEPIVIPADLTDLWPLLGGDGDAWELATSCAVG